MSERFTRSDFEYTQLINPHPLRVASEVIRKLTRYFVDIELSGFTTPPFKTLQLAKGQVLAFDGLGIELIDNIELIQAWKRGVKVKVRGDLGRWEPGEVITQRVNRQADVRVRMLEPVIASILDGSRFVKMVIVARKGSTGLPAEFYSLPNGCNEFQLAHNLLIQFQTPQTVHRDHPTWVQVMQVGDGEWEEGASYQVNVGGIYISIELGE